MIKSEQLALYAVSDRSWLKPGETLASVTETLIQAGVTCVQLREKNQPDEEILRQARELLPICRRHGVPCIINDRPDLAKQIGADGVHVGLSDMGIEKARAILGPDAIIGGSAHNVAENSSPASHAEPKISPSRWRISSLRGMIGFLL